MELADLRAHSTRARITPTSFVNDHSWGNFKGAAETWMEKYELARGDVLALYLGRLSARRAASATTTTSRSPPSWMRLRRHIDLGFEAAAAATCAGVVLDLHRCRGKNSDQPDDAEYDRL